MTDLTIHIKPLIGVTFKGKEIRFEMNQKEIENILGKPSKFTVSNLINYIEEPRDGTIYNYEFEGDYNVNYGTEKLRSIDIPIGIGMKIFYEEIDIFNDKEAVLKLSKYDTPTADDGKFMNFYKLGICLGGYGHKKVPEKKLVTVFPENQKEWFISRYKTGGGRITHKIEKVKMWYEREESKNNK